MKRDKGCMMPKKTRESIGHYVAIDDLVPWDKNPRNNEAAVDEVAASIRRFGFGAPIIARAADSMVIAGHTRLKAARKLGLDKVPVRFLDLDPTEAQLLAIADNKVGEIAEWDDEALRDVLASLDAEGALDGIEGLGFDQVELDQLLRSPLDGDDKAEPEGHLDPFDGPADSAQGQVYELGPHRLICGDCRDAEQVARLFDGAAVDMAFTSPPYASQRAYDESSGFKPIRPDDFCDWFDAVQANVRAHLADHGSWFVNIKEHCEDGQRSLYVKDLTIAHVRRWGWRFVDEFCWKRSGVPGKWSNRFKNQWEPVFHFAAKATIRFIPEAVSHHSSDVVAYSPDTSKTHSGFISKAAGGRFDGLALPGNVLMVQTSPGQIASDGVKHTATFPVGLPSFFVRAFTKEGDRVFDPFMGSGTTLIAAAKHGRIAYGCELSPTYCDLIRRRWTRWAKEHGEDPGPGALEDPE